MDELNITDMVLAAYLSLVGIDVVRHELDPEGNCIWVYESSHEINQRLIEYSTGNALVTPQDYSRAFGRIKRNMFDFINHKAR